MIKFNEIDFDKTLAEAENMQSEDIQGRLEPLRTAFLAAHPKSFANASRDEMLILCLCVGLAELHSRINILEGKESED